MNRITSKLPDPIDLQTYVDRIVFSNKWFSTIWIGILGAVVTALSLTYRWNWSWQLMSLTAVIPALAFLVLRLVTYKPPTEEYRQVILAEREQIRTDLGDAADTGWRVIVIGPLARWATKEVLMFGAIIVLAFGLFGLLQVGPWGGPVRAYFGIPTEKQIEQATVTQVEPVALNAVRSSGPLSLHYTHPPVVDGPLSVATWVEVRMDGVPLNRLTGKVLAVLVDGSETTFSVFPYGERYLVATEKRPMASFVIRARIEDHEVEADVLEPINQAPQRVELAEQNQTSQQVARAAAMDIPRASEPQVTIGSRVQVVEGGCSMMIPFGNGTQAEERPMALNPGQELIVTSLSPFEAQLVSSGDSGRLSLDCQLAVITRPERRVPWGILWITLATVFLIVGVRYRSRVQPLFAGAIAAIPHRGQTGAEGDGLFEQVYTYLESTGDTPITREGLGRIVGADNVSDWYDWLVAEGYIDGRGRPTLETEEPAPEPEPAEAA